MSKAKEAASIPVFEGGPKFGDVLRAVLLSKPKKKATHKRKKKKVSVRLVGRMNNDGTLS